MNLSVLILRPFSTFSFIPHDTRDDKQKTLVFAHSIYLYGKISPVRVDWILLHVRFSTFYFVSFLFSLYFACFVRSYKHKITKKQNC